MKTWLTSLALAISCSAAAQTADDQPFAGTFVNTDLDVCLQIDLYNQDVVISGQEIFGPLPGYLQKRSNKFCWIVASARVKGAKAELQMVNDYGSDDLTAVLVLDNDSTLTLKQQSGAAIKVPDKGKWQKLPHSFQLKRIKSGK